MLMTSNVLSNYKFNFNCTDALLYKCKINSHDVLSPRRKQGRKISFKSNKRIYSTITSHVNISESNDLNTHNIDNVIETQTFLVSTFTPNVYQMNSLIFRKKLIQSQVLVSMRKIWTTTIQVNK